VPSDQFFNLLCGIIAEIELMFCEETYGYDFTILDYSASDKVVSLRR
jgi:hypothetical protein